nr:uncharacterized protein LOC113696287 [Coffea arabica]XP_027095104.1 uncharacterized protein LOC113715123 [Coffea arabica]
MPTHAAGFSKYKRKPTPDTGIPSHPVHHLLAVSMSCLSFNKLLPSRKAWRVFTDKVQTKLHKLHPSKTIKKPKNRLKKTGKKTSCWPAFCTQSKVQRKRFKHKPSQTQTLRSYYVHKRPSAVYIDRLFIEPAAVSLVRVHSQPPKKAAATTASKEYQEVCPSTLNTEKPELVDQRENTAGTSKEEEKLNENMHSADDMWESLVLASPQMNGINERAEEFITRFRAEMLLQEQLAHYL